MAKPIVLPSMHPKRGNPNWGKAGPHIRATATEFEKQVRRLGLTKEACAGSIDLRKWCELHRNQCYIPEWLLALWGIEVDALSLR
jgi:hypothetical protein